MGPLLQFQNCRWSPRSPKAPGLPAKDPTIPVCTCLLCLIPRQLLLHQWPHFLPLARGRRLKWASEGGTWLTRCRVPGDMLYSSMQLSHTFSRLSYKRHFSGRLPKTTGCCMFGRVIPAILTVFCVTLHTAVDAAEDYLM